MEIILFNSTEPHFKETRLSLYSPILLVIVVYLELEGEKIIIIKSLFFLFYSDIPPLYDQKKICQENNTKGKAFLGMKSHFKMLCF